MTRIALLLAGGATVAALAATSALAQTQGEGDRPRTTVVPYIELGQVANADLNSGDVLTYTSIAAGIDAQIDTRRATGQLSYRYERQIGESRGAGDADIHSGLARGVVKLLPGLSLEGGGIATRTRSDIRGDAPGTLVGNVGNTSQLYSVYAGPAYSGQFGAIALNAAYRVGYTKVDTPTTTTLPTGQQRLDYYDDSIGHTVTASAGFAPGTLLPVGLTATAGYERETASQLNQRYEGYYGRGDALLPVAPTVALTAGVGYEKIETSQKDPLLDATGTPVLDRNGRFVTNEASPQRIAYRTDGVYYDAGVIWRPNRRTSVEAHVGRRYGSASYTGRASYQASRSINFAAQVYDQVETFGQQLTTGLSNLPTTFLAARNAFTQQYNGCVFSTTGSTPGGCLNDVFQSVSTASYRARGVDALLTAKRGLSTFGVGVGYSNRKLFAPNVPSGVVVYGQEDQSYYGELFYARSLGPRSGINAQAFANYYISGLVNADDVVSLGGTVTYYHNFGRIGATASAGLYSFKVGDLATALSGQALLGARYQF